ncbi:MAG: MMPL family transporter [Oscillospiraceae bacterium]
MQKIAAFIVKKRKLLLVVMLALAVVCAALMPFVGINTDMTKYLPDSSQMKIGMDRMNEAFPDVAETYTIRVMFRGLDARDKLAIREQLTEIPNVDSVAYEPDSDDYNRGDATLYKLTTQYDYKSDEEAQIERDVADRFDGYDVAVRSDDTSTPDIPPIVFILSIVLVTTILLIACPSYFEPVLFLITIGIAVLINQGTNIILGETSDVTASISAILQLALSMDYSIILMNRYRQELQADPDREAAMTRALTAAFGSITGSSVTTIVGLLMLVFMRFKIGMDLGIVLAKGVLCSLLCVFTVLPGLILWGDKLIRKMTKKPRAPKRERKSVLAALGSFSYRWRGAIAAAFVLLFAGTYVLQLSTQIAYTLTDTDPVAEVFPPDNPIVVLYNNADEDAVAALADRLEADPNVKSAMSYSTTLGRQYTATQMADIVGALDASIPVSADMLGMIYYDVYSGGRAVTIPAGQFLRFLTEHVANNAAFAPYLDAGMTANLQKLQKFTDPAALTQQRTAESLADFLGMDAADAKQLLLYYYTQHGDASTGGMTLPVFSDFLVNEVLTDPTMAGMIDASAREQAAMLQTFTNVSAMTTPRGCGEIAQMLGMDEETVRLLFVAYHAANVDLITGGWDVSMQDLANFLPTTAPCSTARRAADHDAQLDHQRLCLRHELLGAGACRPPRHGRRADAPAHLLYISRTATRADGRSRCSSSWTSCVRRCCRTRALPPSSAAWTPASSSRRARSSTRSPPVGAIRLRNWQTCFRACPASWTAARWSCCSSTMPACTAAMPRGPCPCRSCLTICKMTCSRTRALPPS